MMHFKNKNPTIDNSTRSLTISQTGTLAIPKNLDTFKATGPDDISCKMIRNDLTISKKYFWYS